MARQSLELWFPLSASYPTNPKVWAAGFEASMAHLALMMAAKKFSKSSAGNLLADCWRSAFLMQHLGVWAEKITSEDLEKGMDAAVRFGLVEFAKEGSKDVVRPHDWEHYNDQVRRTFYKMDRERRQQSTSKTPAKRQRKASKMPAPPSDSPPNSTEHNITEQESLETSFLLKARDLANMLANEHWKQKPKLKLKPNGWVSDIEKLIRIDGASPERIEAVIKWVTHDYDESDSKWGGWAPNIRSGYKLRDKFDRLEEEMERQKNRKNKTEQITLAPINYNSESGK
jgi:hypothetical protein